MDSSKLKEVPAPDKDFLFKPQPGSPDSQVRSLDLCLLSFLLFYRCEETPRPRPLRAGGHGLEQHLKAERELTRNARDFENVKAHPQ